MRGPGGTTTCYDYYIVRIYRHDPASVETRSELTGIVEAGDGHQKAFHGTDDLLRILMENQTPHYPQLP